MTLIRLSLFDFRQIRYTFAKKPGAILRCARIMLGLTQSDVVRATKRIGMRMSLGRYRAIESDFEGRIIGAMEWFVLCRVLGLSCDNFSVGYNARWHLMKVRADVKNGAFRLPLTAPLEARLGAYEDWEASQQERWMMRPGLRFSLQRQVTNADSQEGARDE